MIVCIICYYSRIGNVAIDYLIDAKVQYYIEVLRQHVRNLTAKKRKHMSFADIVVRYAKKKEQEKKMKKCLGSLDPNHSADSSTHSVWDTFLPHPAAETRVVVIVGTQSYTSPGYATRIQARLDEEFPDTLGCELKYMNDYDPALLKHEKRRVIIVTSTYGSGGAPKNGEWCLRLGRACGFLYNARFVSILASE